jgi:membrane associated rhomboid family serine protease
MVFPLYDDNPFARSTLPFVTWGLIGLNILVFLTEITAPSDTARAMVVSLGATPAAIFGHAPQAGPLAPELTLITSMFMHAGWAHLIGNMVYLWVFGDDIEAALGWWRYLAFYLLAGIAAALAYAAMNPHSTTPLVGASGAISGILAAYLMLRPCAKVAVLVMRMVVRTRAWLVIAFWILLQMFLLIDRRHDGVAYLAHLGGVVAGAGLFLVMRPAGVKLFDCQDDGENDFSPA